MAIHLYKTSTPSTRNETVDSQVKSNPRNYLIYGQHHCGKGRNARGIITARHRGGGHKRLYQVPKKMGNALPLRVLIDQKEESTSTDMPLGTAIHNIEITLGKGGQLVRAAGAVAKLIAKEGKSATLKLPSGEVRLISKNCSATVGQVGNVGANQKSLGRAGSKRWLGKRPVVRGVVMNPVDHPHGGGEGRAPIGRKKPTTPWGYPALGRRSRKRNKYSDNLIVRHRSK
ncbi:60S ribosomal protein L2A [Salvia divinorum]|uniref:60S ribosomal protein L2A n=1 Tax=Salvia divinorum TaxID=28513 RepID=A0ABD1IFV9_SALDI